MRSFACVSFGLSALGINFIRCVNFFRFSMAHPPAATVSRLHAPSGLFAANLDVTWLTCIGRKKPTSSPYCDTKSSQMLRTLHLGV